MSTYKDRIAQVERFVNDENITKPEAMIMLWQWYRFERAVRLRGKHDRKARQIQKKIDQNLTVFQFRKELAKK